MRFYRVSFHCFLLLVYNGIVLLQCQCSQDDPLAAHLIEQSTCSDTQRSMPPPQILGSTQPSVSWGRWKKFYFCCFCLWVCSVVVNKMKYQRTVCVWVAWHVTRGFAWLRGTSVNVSQCIWPWPWPRWDEPRVELVLAIDTRCRYCRAYFGFDLLIIYLVIFRRIAFHPASILCGVSWLTDLFLDRTVECFSVSKKGCWIISLIYCVEYRKDWKWVWAILRWWL